MGAWSLWQKCALFTVIIGALTAGGTLVVLAVLNSLGSDALSGRALLLTKRRVTNNTSPFVALRPAFSNAERRPPDALLTRLRVFQRPRRASDQLPMEIIEELVGDSAPAEPAARDIPAFLQKGRPVVKRSRRAFPDEENTQFYVFPTSSGWVCYVVVDGTVNCVPDLEQSISWGLDQLPEGGLVVHGLFADDVADVSLMTARHEAPMPLKIGESAFYSVYSDMKLAEVTGFAVAYVDGHHEVVPVGAVP